MQYTPIFPAMCFTRHTNISQADRKAQFLLVKNYTDR